MSDGARLGHELSLWVVLFHEAVAAHLGVNATEHKVLDCIAHEPGISPGRLVQLTGLSNPAITKVVNRLVELGYVERSRDATDGRKVSLTAAKRHTKAMAGLYQPMTSKMDHLVRGFSLAEQQVVARWLSGTIDIMRDAALGLNARGPASPAAVLRAAEGSATAKVAINEIIGMNAKRRSR